MDGLRGLLPRVCAGEGGAAAGAGAWLVRVVLLTAWVCLRTMQRPGELRGWQGAGGGANPALLCSLTSWPELAWHALQQQQNTPHTLP